MPSLKPDRDKNFGGSLVFDFGQWWRHVKTIYTKRQVRQIIWNVLLHNFYNRLVCFSCEIFKSVVVTRPFSCCSSLFKQIHEANRKAKILTFATYQPRRESTWPSSSVKIKENWPRWSRWPWKSAFSFRTTISGIPLMNWIKLVRQLELKSISPMQ